MFPSENLVRRAVGQKQGYQLAANPGSHGSLTVDGPSKHGTAVDVLNEAGKLGCVAGAKFAGSDGAIEEFFGFVANNAELIESDSVKVRVG